MKKSHIIHTNSCKSHILIIILMKITCELNKISYFCHRLPWDQSKLSGYVAEKCLDLLIGGTYFLPLAAVLLLFISLCLHHRTFHQMFDHKLLQMGKLNRAQNEKELICFLIRFHTTVKR